MEDTESSETSVDDRIEDLSESPTRDALADGLIELLRPTVEQIDERVKSTRISQMELRQQIDSLAEDLRHVSENQHVPYDLDIYVKKLMNAKRRVMLVSNILQNAQERLNRVHHNVAKETAKRKALLEPSSVASSGEAD
ncbi:SNAP associated protein [Tachypleus tridentatus]|uniref:SNAP associated protein n=1 Tax=Tachypleus tridentatus TaxID=6853 RepID=UPI003FD1BDE9